MKIPINKIRKIVAMLKFSRKHVAMLSKHAQHRIFNFPAHMEIAGGGISGFKDGGIPHLYSAVTLSIYLFINLLEALFEVLFRYFKAGSAQCTVFIFIQSTLDILEYSHVHKVLQIKGIMV